MMFASVGLAAPPAQGEDFAAPFAAYEQDMLLAKKGRKRRGRAKTGTKKKGVSEGVLIGGGLMNLFPPMLTVHGLYRASAFEAGAELGYMIIPLSEFSGTSTYAGVDGRFFFSEALAGGLGLGQRTFQIVTSSNLNHDNGSTEITWTRDVSQIIATPHIAYEPRKSKGVQLLVTFGLVIPLSSTLTISRDVDSIEGVPDSVLAEEQDEKAKAVSDVTDAVLPLLGIKALLPI